MNYYLIYTKLPETLQAWISKLIYKPQTGKHVELRGKTFFHGHVDIGDYTEINTHAYLANVKIGKYCSIGKDFRTIVVNHRMDLFTTKAIGCVYKKKYIDINPEYQPYWEGRVIIGNDVWIGENVTIIAPFEGAITIGSGAVIGAGSVVTKDIPPYAVCVGVPARIIKYRFDEKTIRKLLEEKWWDWDENQIYSRYRKEYENKEVHNDSNGIRDHSDL